MEDDLLPPPAPPEDKLDPDKVVVEADAVEDGTCNCRDGGTEAEEGPLCCCWW